MCIEDKIRGHLETEFERDLFDAALANLNEPANKLRFNNFAYTIRELTRHLLKRLAPDEQVKKCTWYRNETRDPNKLSRRERIIYAVQGGLSNTYIKNTLKIDVVPLNREVSQIINNLSKFTHINPSTFNIDRTLVEQHKNDTLETLLKLLDFIVSTKESIVQPLQEQIFDEVLQQALNDTYDTIGLVGMHAYMEDVWVHDHEVEDIDSEYVYITAHGSIDVEHSDGSRHDPAVVNHSWPFTSKFKCEVSAPTQLIDERPELEVDESSWYG